MLFFEKTKKTNIFFHSTFFQRTKNCLAAFRIRIKMAVGGVGQAPFVCYVEKRPVVERSQSRRTIVAGALVAAALCGAVLVVLSPSAGVSTAEKATAIKPTAVKVGLQSHSALAPQDSRLAIMLLKAAPHSKVQQLHQMVKTWQDKVVSSDDTDLSHGTVLAAVPRSITQALQASGNLCAKKDMIFDKFDALLKKLGAESFDRNQTDAAAEMAKDESMKAWLESESSYRLQLEKQKEAEEGAKFARDRYEKWAQTVLSTEDRVTTMSASYAKEKESIADQRSLIKEILRMLGIMADQPLDAATAAAGGYMSKKGMSKPQQLTLSQVKAKIAELKQEAVAGGPISLREVDLLQSKLANFAETDEVKDLLGNMLKDLDLRESVIDSSLAAATKELQEHKDKLLNYEKQVVDLSNAADSAAMKVHQKNLERQDLNGKKITAGETYEDEHAEYVVVAPPADRSIYILKVIMAKINEFCTHGTTSTVEKS